MVVWRGRSEGMKICLDCKHLETSWVDGGEGVPEFLEGF